MHYLLPRDPFTDIGRTIPEFHSVGLAESKEFHGFSVDKKNVFEIDGEAARFLFQYAPKHVDMFSCNPAAYEQHHEIFSSNDSVDSAAHFFYSLPSRAGLRALDVATDEATCSSFIARKGLSHEFFTFVPERLRRRRIECISAYSFARGANGHVVRHDIADVAVLAISATDFFSWNHDRGPYRSCRTLRAGHLVDQSHSLCR